MLGKYFQVSASVPIVTSGLVARYACDDATSGSAVTTVTDSAGVGPWNLTATGHTWNSQGISFAGNNASYARNTSFNPSISAAWTIEVVALIAAPDTAKVLNIVAGFGNNTTVRPTLWLGGSFAGDASTANKAVAVNDGVVSSSVANSYTTAADGGIWRHAAVAYDNALSPKMNQYKDTTLLTAFSSNITGNIAAFNTFILGNRADLNTALCWTGTVAYALIYNRALSAAEVSQNHAALKSLLAPRGIALA